MNSELHSAARAPRIVRSLPRWLMLTYLVAGPLGMLLVAPPAAAQEPQYYRLQLEQGSKYLDADHCSDQVGLNPGSDMRTAPVSCGGSFPLAVDGTGCS